MLSILINPTFLSALYTGHAIWHCAAFAHFGLWPEHTMLIGTTRSQSKDPKIHSAPGGDDWHHDLFRYLGYINSAFAVLAGLRLYRIPWTGSEVGDAALDVLALAVLGWANGSQAYLDLRIRKDGRWELNGFEIITAMDTAFAVLDFASIAALLTAGSV
jgi:hypothetical protein